MPYARRLLAKMRALRVALSRSAASIIKTPTPRETRPECPPRRQQQTLATLPHEVLLVVFSHLSFNHSATLGLTCIQFYTIHHYLHASRFWVSPDAITLEKLPTEILLLIFSHLSPVHSTALGLTCPQFYAIHHDLHGIVPLHPILTTPAADYPSWVRPLPLNFWLYSENAFFIFPFPELQKFTVRKMLPVDELPSDRIRSRRAKDARLVRQGLCQQTQRTEGGWETTAGV